MTLAVGIRLVILVVILTWPPFFSWLSELDDGPGRIWFMLHQAYYLPFSWVGAPLFEPDSKVGFEVQPTGRAFAAFFYVLWFYVIIRIIDRAKLASVYRERRSDAIRNRGDR
jgi:hypothetical protein